MTEPEIERVDRTAIVHLRGDLVAATTPALDELLAGLARDADTIRLDFSQVGRIDSSAVAVVRLARRSVKIELDHLHPRDRALLDAPPPPPPPAELHIGPFERLGERALAIGDGTRAFGKLVADTARSAIAILFRRAHVPEGSISQQMQLMGTNAVPIVSLLAFLLGMTIAFQGAVQLRRFGAEMFVADLVSLSMVREFAPLVTAIIVTGRTGAAIAAELGTMRAGAEIDVLQAMGISPTRFLVVPRVAALTVVVPVLTLIAMFVGMVGGMIVAEASLRLSPVSFWVRAIERLSAIDFLRGLVKSVAFAWIIGFSGAHLGLRARRDASGVGSAATRAVVAAVFWIIVFDAAFESITAALRSP
jgi:phospholipid/cholesterol/gamma-HCH transport system permease protein